MVRITVGQLSTLTTLAHPSVAINRGKARTEGSKVKKNTHLGLKPAAKAQWKRSWRKATLDTPHPFSCGITCDLMYLWGDWYCKEKNWKLETIHFPNACKNVPKKCKKTTGRLGDWLFGQLPPPGYYWGPLQKGNKLVRHRKLLPSG